MQRRKVIQAIIAGCSAPVLTQLVPQVAFGKNSKFFATENDYYCSANVLATAWNKPVEDIKAYIDQKLSDDVPTLKKDLDKARKKISYKADSLCPYEWYGYRYEQMESLAKYWKIDTFTAKAKANTLLFNANGAKLDHLVKKADQKFPNKPAQKPAASQSAGDDMYSKFQATYSYCDAEALAFHWHLDVDTAKSKLVDMTKSEAKKTMQEVRKSPAVRAQASENRICDYSGDFSYSDLEKLSKIWKLDVYTTKSEVSLKILDGKINEVKQTLSAKSSKSSKSSKSIKVKKSILKKRRGKKLLKKKRLKK